MFEGNLQMRFTLDRIKARLARLVDKSCTVDVKSRFYRQSQFEGGILDNSE